MEDELASPDDERYIELSSIEAIYPEIKLDPSKPLTASLDIAVTPVKPLRIHFKPAADGIPPLLPTPPTSTEAGTDDADKPPTIEHNVIPADAHDLSHLPPLQLKIDLPEGYPATKPPHVAILVEPAWLPQQIVQTSKDDCARLWEELGKDQVVYTYIDHLQQAAETAFGLTEQPDEVALSADLKLALLDFDLKTKGEQFDRGTFDCGICLEPKKGTKCHRMLLCSHVFCVACLQDFYTSCITDGDVDNVKCMDPSCGKGNTADTPQKRRKQDRTLDPSELLQIPLSQELVQRYVRLKRKKKIESDKNTVYCPRQWCQGVAKSKKHPKPVDPMHDMDEDVSEPEETGQQTKDIDPNRIPMSERLSVCEDCNYAFCSVCKKGWHGELANCNPRRQAELTEEEKATAEYLQKYSTPCPTCDAPSQKTMGCNHMICFKCKTHFCYLCSSYLMPANPYTHFNDQKSTCYMRLWELEAGDGAEVNHIGFGGGAEPEMGLEAWMEDGAESDTSSDEDQAFEGFADEDEDTEDDEPAPDQRRQNRGPMQIEIVNFARGGVNNRRILNLPERPRVEAAPPAAPNPPRRQNRGGGQQANRQRALQQEPHRRAPARQARRNPRNNENNNMDALLQEAARQMGAIPGVGQLDNDNNAPQVIPPPHHPYARIFFQRPNPPPPPIFDPNPIVRDDDGPDAEIEMVHANPAPGQARDAAAQPAPLRAMGLERFLELARRDQEDEWDSDELDDDISDVDDGDGLVEQEARLRARVPRMGNARARGRDLRFG